MKFVHILSVRFTRSCQVKHVSIIEKKLNLVADLFLEISHLQFFCFCFFILFYTTLLDKQNIAANLYSKHLSEYWLVKVCIINICITYRRTYQTLPVFFENLVIFNLKKYNIILDEKKTQNPTGPVLRLNTFKKPVSMCFQWNLLYFWIRILKEKAS